LINGVPFFTFADCYGNSGYLAATKVNIFTSMTNNNNKNYVNVRKKTFAINLSL